jgi:threonylcarbamoyladenosine tRNA methylthiotransferase MtaB
MRVYFHTFGCKTNQYDTEVVRQAFAEQGATAVNDPAQADLAVLNSCTVTAAGEAKLRGLARRLARGRVETVVMGCAAAVDDGTLAAMPGVRAVVGGADAGAVLRAAGLPPAALGPGVRRFAASARAWLKIQDGCDEHCTFCATTIARGANRSRPVAQLVTEARALAMHHAEIVLTGVHIGSYGRDQGVVGGEWSTPSHAGSRSERTTHHSPRRSSAAATLSLLLEALIAAVPTVRFRLSSIEATEIDDRIERLLVEAPRHLAAHVHAPLQSGSDRVLRRMGRHWYTAASYRARLEHLAARLPAFGLGADVMVGFPGEAVADHHATRDLIAALPFTYLHVFPYSERPGTAARRLGPAVGSAAVRARAAELRELGAAKGETYRAARRGRRADAVACGHAAGRVEMLTEDYLTVYLESDRWDGKPRTDVVID